MNGPKIVVQELYKIYRSYRASRGYACFQMSHSWAFTENLSNPFSDLQK